MHLKTVLSHMSYLRYVCLVPFLIIIFFNDDNCLFEEASESASIAKI